MLKFLQNDDAKIK